MADKFPITEQYITEITQADISVRIRSEVPGEWKLIDDGDGDAFSTEHLHVIRDMIDRAIATETPTTDKDFCKESE